MLENKFACLISTFSSLHNSYKQFYQYSVNTKITVFNAKTQFALVHHQLALSVQVPSQAVVLI